MTSSQTASGASPLLSWPEHRAAGILLHPVSLPGDLGIGKFGREARRFIDFLEAAGMSYWQVCPLGPTGFGDSPYQCFSAFAGNPYFIDLHPMVSLGLLDPRDLKPLQQLPRARVDYGTLYARMGPVLNKLAMAFMARGESVPGYGDFQTFKQNQQAWLDPYSCFRAAKTHFAEKAWLKWPKTARTHAAFLDTPLPAKLHEAVERERVLQYLFWGQWRELRGYANDHGIRIIGDAPIFVALDSADVWAAPEQFQLGKDHTPTAVAGVPPDYFSATGQLWGNPLYRWDRMQKNGFDWWMQRLKANFSAFDVLRLDHFRGFADYWAVPAKNKDARKGKWQPGPGLPFFRAIKDAFPQARIIAEDLGEITPEVTALREATGLPGMSVLQFAFGGGSDNVYLPHNHNPNTVVYPGTHDNNTALGWYENADEGTRDHFRRYLGVDGKAPQWDLLRAAYRSVAKVAVIPMQDLFNLGEPARLNTPGCAAGNWGWRFTDEQFDTLWRESVGYLRQLKDLYGR